MMLFDVPDEYIPDIRKGAAWCPYCGSAKLFVWDSLLSVSRCPDCGISAEDYYVRTANKGRAQGSKKIYSLCSDHGKIKFDNNVKKSRRRWPREKKKTEQTGDSQAPVQKPQPRQASGGRILPKQVLSRVKEMVAECANYSYTGPADTKNYCMLESGPGSTCVFFLDDNTCTESSHRCRWFETVILPLAPELQKLYRQGMNKSARLTSEDSWKQSRLKVIPP